MNYTVIGILAAGALLFALLDTDKRRRRPPHLQAKRDKYLARREEELAKETEDEQPGFHWTQSDYN